ncbi:DUF3566 domain-containing protein [Actinomadura rupiterrae]|uniref:DUF3566 domain-containing protein n=1 Tax=Actinomadura rupiterrae TaxID=559627 RepID=UPI0020A37227|nr:DUF3566 domain-containing protein [Actinomadura rupiterrae]MCP2340576.1 hypothetical protein [Actinomadura rupiterrae]
MSSEPGKDRPSGDKGTTGKPPARGKAVPATSKPGRDEATVEITGDETKHDLPKVEDRPSVTSAAAKPGPGRPGSAKPGSAKPSGPAKPAWDEPAEPADSVSTDRTEKRFTRAESPSAAAAAASAPSGGGFAGTVLKDRPATPPPSRPAPSPAAPARPAAPGKSARKAQLQLARLEPWSVMKFSFVMSLVCFVVLLVAVIVLWMILSGLGVFDAIANTVHDLTSKQGEDSGGVDAGSWFSFVRVLGYTVLVGALNVMLITALSTVGAVIYNLAADLVGGVEVTLKEAE